MGGVLLVYLYNQPKRGTIQKGRGTPVSLSLIIYDTYCPGVFGREHPQPASPRKNLPSISQPTMPTRFLGISRPGDLWAWNERSGCEVGSAPLRGVQPRGDLRLLRPQPQWGLLI